MTLDAGVTRRRLLAATAGLGALLGLPACSAGEPAPAAAGPGWDFTDARGVDARLPRRPERVVAYTGVAAVLWDYGVRPVGIFGPQRREDGSPDTTVGDVDLASVGSAGESYESLDYEALAALRPDLVVRAAVAAKPNLRVLVTYAEPEGLSIAGRASSRTC